MSEGSIGYYDSSSVLTELTSGGSGTILTMGATIPAWAASGGITLNRILVETGTQFSSSSSTLIDVTDMTFTASAVTGHGVCSCDSYMSMNEGGGTGYWRWTASVDGDQATQRCYGSSSLGKLNMNLPFITSTLNSQVCKIQAKNDDGYNWYFAVDGEGVSRIQVLEIS